MRQPRLGLAFALLLTALLSAGCPPPDDPDAGAPLEVEAGCQPLFGGGECFLPFPSDYFRVADASTRTGYRVEVTDEAGMWTDEGYSADVTDYRAVDGFQTTGPIVAWLGQEIDPEGLVTIFDDPDASLSAESKTVLVNAETGELVPHYTDVDPRAETLDRQAIVLHPRVELVAETRYVVALQGFTTPSGALSVPEGFRRLRDGESDDSLTDFQTRYDTDIFPVLEAAGLTRGDLQLAWDFTTGSELGAIGDMLRARELVLAELERTPPVVEISSRLEGGGDNTWFRVLGFVTGPAVLENLAPGSELARDADGEVKLNGTARFPFTIVVPNAVKERYAPADLLLFGHGFFGSRGEVESALSGRLYERLETVVVGIDWWGMATEDIGTVVADLGSQVSQAARFGERVPQAMANWLTITHALNTGLFDDIEELKRPSALDGEGVVVNPDNADETNAGQLVFAGPAASFLGISQGHILGGTLTALNPSIRRSVLHVGGSSFTEMMFRANPFNRFLLLLDLKTPDPFLQQKLAATFQLHFDRFGPARYAKYVRQAPLPHGPTGDQEGREVLLQMAMGDTQVPNVAMELHARQLGIPHLLPSPREIWGLETATDSIEGSAITAFDFGIDLSFYANAEPAPDNNRVHDELRDKPEVATQMRTFLETGVINAACAGPCVFPTPVVEN